MSEPKKEPKNQAVAKTKEEIRAELVATGKRIQAIRQQYAAELAGAENDYERASTLGCALIDLRVAVAQYLPMLNQLKGSKLGFRTDRDDPSKPQYPDTVVVDCAIEAVIRGARWTGNEFNILAGGCYLTKEYWWRQVTQEISGLTDLDLNPGVPEFVNQKCVVTFEASWKLDGKEQKMVRKIPILMRSGQSDDATLGKAEGRMLKAIHKRITGTATTDADDEEAITAKEPEKPAVTNGKPPAIEASKPKEQPAAKPPLAEGEVSEAEEEAAAMDWSQQANDEKERAAATR